MSFHCERRKMENEKVSSMNDITSEFACLKVSALKKASRISVENDSITIGPQSVVNNNDTNKLENIENEQNSCNIKSPKKTSIIPKHNTISTLNGISFSIRKIFQERELQRREEVRKVIERHIQHMKENRRAIQEKMANSRSSMARERERKSAEKLAYILAEEERKAEQEEIERRHKQQLQAQRAQEQKEKHEREVEEYRKVKEQEELMRDVIIQRDQFTAKYCDIVALSKACKDKHAFNVLFAANASRIKELCLQIETIDEKIKNEDLVATDLIAIETVVRHIDDMLNLLRTEIERIDAEYEAKLAHETGNQMLQSVTVNENIPADKLLPSRQPNESDITEKDEDKDQNSNAIANLQAAVAPSIINTSSASDLKVEETSKDSGENNESNRDEYIDEESLQIYIRNKEFLAIYRQNYKDFSQSADTKKFRFECQKAINIPVNAISGISEQHLRDKYDRLQNFLIGKSSPNVKQYPQGEVFCKDHLAKKIVSQGETLVSSKPEMAFPIAAIVIALWNDHSDFGELFLANLHEACPFTVPIFLPQQKGQSNEDYYKSLGCKYSEDGTVEKQDKFLKRMSGLMRLYASITVTEQRKNVTKTHPHGLQYAWRWLAAVLNIEPRPNMCDLCATLILDMLEVAGNVLWTAYPKQFHKLLILLMEQYYPRVQNIASTGSGPLVRLEEFLNNALTKGNIRPADGLLPPHFW